MRTFWLLLILGSIAGTAALAEPGALLIGGCTMVPVRYIGESVGATVSYDTATKKVSLSIGAAPIILAVDSPVAYVDNRPIHLDACATVIDGVTYVPVRFVCENFGAQVQWDQPTRRVTIHHPRHRGPMVLFARECSRPNVVVRHDNGRRPVHVDRPSPSRDHRDNGKHRGRK